MDNLILIGYRIDCSVDNVVKDEDKLYDLKKEGFPIDGLPGEEWMFWPHVKDNKISIFPIDGEFRGDYRCPIDKSEIYKALFKALFKDSFDVPDDFLNITQKIRSTKLYEKLESLFKVKVTWGIFLGLG